ncbi:carbohydrate ABC transporter permease [Aneurinibacillus sp. REN35]|uniref:carbohydrate ABC transporter permease n=1 Tax=Aneurinibacillus sp. REN35 TaxID=3237286 RepID=UPI0035286599
MQNQRTLSNLMFLFPVSIVIFTFLLLPMLQTLYYSFTDWQGIGEYRFIGLENYTQVFQDETYLDALWRTLFIGTSAALLANVFGLGLALVLNQALKTKNILRALFYIPNVVPVVVAAFVWQFMLSGNGLINSLFSIKIPWLDSPQYVVFSIIGISVWQMIGPIMIVYLAALQGVPDELKEAAMVDGASAVRRFFTVTVPMIAPGITVNVLIGLANGIRLFDLPYALTGGGPANASETLAIRIYKYAFESANLTFGMAASVVMTVVVLILTYFFVGLSTKYERST